MVFVVLVGWLVLVGWCWLVGVGWLVLVGCLFGWLFGFVLCWFYIFVGRIISQKDLLGGGEEEGGARRGGGGVGRARVDEEADAEWGPTAPARDLTVLYSQSQTRCRMSGGADLLTYSLEMPPDGTETTCPVRYNGTMCLLESTMYRYVRVLMHVDDEQDGIPTS